MSSSVHCQCAKRAVYDALAVAGKYQVHFPKSAPNRSGREVPVPVGRAWSCDSLRRGDMVYDINSKVRRYLKLRNPLAYVYMYNGFPTGSKQRDKRNDKW